MQLRQHLREATVVLTSAEESVYVGAIEKLTSANPSTADQLTRLRLSFGIERTDDDVGRFDEQLRTAGMQIEPHDVQLRRSVAAGVLAARFGRTPGRRSLTKLAPDTASALGARILVRAQRRPVHPDVGTWASYWVERLAIHLREPRQLPTAPAFSPEIPAVDATVSPSDAVTQLTAALQSSFTSFVDELLKWSGELDPAEVMAQGEQIDLLWWLQGGAVPKAAPERTAWAASQLRKHTRRIPGPPQANQLLRHRLGDIAKKPTTLEEVAAQVTRAVPDAIADLCPLLTRNEAMLDGRSLECVAAAEWLLDELTLIDLIESA